MNKRLLMILALSLVIRLIGINQSLWLDEAISVNVVKNNKLTEIATNFSTGDFHPPFYYMTLKIWSEIFGESEFALRMLSVMFGLVTVYVVYLMGGSGAAALAGFNPLLVYYSQEARMYSMVTMLLIIGIYCWQKKKWLWVNIFFGLSFLTFYGSVFLIAGISLYLIIKKQWREVWLINVGLVAAIVINWPLLSKQLEMSEGLRQEVANWDMVLGKANLKNLLLIPLKFTSGRISFYPKVIYYLLAGGWMGVVAVNILRNKYLAIALLGLGIGVIFSIFTPMLQYFRFLYLVPLLALVLRPKWWLVAGFGIWSLVYGLNSNFYREDWKSLVAELPGKVYMIESFGDPIKYYDSRIKIYDLRIKPEQGPVTVIPYGEEIHGVDHKKILEAAGKSLVKTRTYRGVTAEVWE